MHILFEDRACVAKIAIFLNCDMTRRTHMDHTRSTVQHVATSNTAIVVINDILARLAASFSAFRALSDRIFCSKDQACVAETVNF